MSAANFSSAAAALSLAQAAEAHAGLVLAVCVNEQQAYRLEDELRFFLGGRSELPVLHLPDTEVLPYDAFSPHQEILSSRLAALYRLPQMRRGVLVTTADALIQRLPPPAWLEGRTFLLKAGDTLAPLPFREKLAAAGYQSVSEVQMQGEFAVRGALIDLFPMGSEAAYRLDLFDEQIETIRTFDPETQRSESTVPEIRLMPAREFPTDKAGIEIFRRRYREYFSGDLSRGRIYSEVSKGLMPGGIEAYLPLFFEETASLSSYLPAQTLLAEMGDMAQALAEDWKQIEERYSRYEGDLERPLLRPRDLFLPPEEALAGVARYERISVSTVIPAPAGIQFSSLQSQEELDARLRGHDEEKKAAGLSISGSDAVKKLLAEAPDRVLFIAESPGRREALLAWLKPLGIHPREHRHWHDFLNEPKRYGIALGPIQDGFALADGTLLIPEAQVFGLTAPAQQQRRRTKVRDPATLLRDLNDLREGSPVVHLAHGVGRYRGLTKLDAGSTSAEFLVLEYEKGDRIYVPVASLQLVHRYVGAEAQAAPLHALGSERWDKARKRAALRAHDVAAELLQIQARRAARPGMRLAVNDADYQRFCASFPFTPTPDQQKAIDEVLADMAADKPMDRVVCGDVGFGKTEVALRAAFAAVQNGRQVCVLAPTTLLTEQHHKNFADRFAGWPVKVAALSRMRTEREQQTQLRELREGKVDIVIGTHRLLQADVAFKKLGLVMVDEEHRFGVRHKERMKNLRAEVDLLTLTATPIPRTLNMSLAGLRDLSIIATPPEGRLPIRTFVAEDDRGLIHEACLRELRRGGQIYFLHNEVVDIERRAQEIREMVPEASVRHAHGQMRERELEQVMLDFYHRRFNLLVCTTIIESGIDVPSANTILIDRSDQLGLAQLHQLRGRVGRSHHRAYAYLLVPSLRALKPDAAARLQAIETMGELGSGFVLATQDLEIRGAGELLGEEQSGQIEEVGFTLYADLLAEAVASLKSGALEDRPFGASVCEVDLGATALLPDRYIPDVHTRLTFYKRLSEARDAAALDELQAEMVDRFGKLPEAAQRLTEAMRLRQRAQALGIVKLRTGAKSIVLEFGPRPQIEPKTIIRLVQGKPKLYRLEGQRKLHHAVLLENAEARARSAAELLDRLAA